MNRKLAGTIGLGLILTLVLSTGASAGPDYGKLIGVTSDSTVGSPFDPLLYQTKNVSKPPRRGSTVTVQLLGEVQAHAEYGDRADVRGLIECKRNGHDDSVGADYLPHLDPEWIKTVKVAKRLRGLNKCHVFVVASWYPEPLPYPASDWPTGQMTLFVYYKR